MCGIFALLNNQNTFSHNAIESAFAKGQGRGPEHSAIEMCDNKLLLGFHRLAINGLNQESNQPIKIDSCVLICNGEIYNYKTLYKSIGVTPTTDSDCEIIIHLYKLYGIEYTLRLLDGVFSFILYDYNDCAMEPIVYVARDPYGVRPLYVMEPNAKMCYSVDDITPMSNITHENIVGFASELKVLNFLMNYNNTHLHIGDTERISTIKINYNTYAFPYHIHQFPPGSYMCLSCSFKTHSSWKPRLLPTKYHITLQSPRILSPYTEESSKQAQSMVCKILNEAVKKRVVGTSDRPIACLLSGGLDSSLITALVKKYYKHDLETYSIGMPGSVDLIRAKQVADYLGTKHTEIRLTKEQFFAAIPETILAIESYDTTTVRASVGNYLIGKYISQNSDAKVIFNGDGSDEIAGGYLYFLKSPSDLEFDKECRRLLSNINFFDVLRSDKSISSNGLEPRTPFLDRDFVDYYMSIPVSIRNPVSPNKNVANRCEKYLIRNAFYENEPDLLPHDVLWRTKEAFSDGVSGDDGSWFKIIEDKVNELDVADMHQSSRQEISNGVNPPATSEQRYYRHLYNSYYPNTATSIPYFWMPKYVKATDSSARTLDVYNEQTKSSPEQRPS